MADDIIRILYDRNYKIENDKIKKPTGVSAIGNNYRRRDENNKKSFKKALVDANKEIEEEKANHNEEEDIIVSSSLTNLIHENSKIGTIVQERIASNPRINEILKEKSIKIGEPLENKERGKDSEN